jgi:hypothetical protein
LLCTAQLVCTLGRLAWAGVEQVLPIIRVERTRRLGRRSELEGAPSRCAHRATRRVPASKSTSKAQTAISGIGRRLSLDSAAIVLAVSCLNYDLSNSGSHGPWSGAGGDRDSLSRRDSAPGGRSRCCSLCIVIPDPAKPEDQPEYNARTMHAPAATRESRLPIEARSESAVLVFKFIAHLSAPRPRRPSSCANVPLSLLPA